MPFQFVRKNVQYVDNPSRTDFESARRNYFGARFENVQRRRSKRVGFEACLLAGIVLSLFRNFAVAAKLLRPPGLDPGDSFRFIVQTAGTTAGTSWDISTDNTFVNQQAGGVDIGGQPLTWCAIGLTATVNARGNVGGFATAAPVYLNTGSPVASIPNTSAVEFMVCRAFE